jgi:hypothetical protein
MSVKNEFEIEIDGTQYTCVLDVDAMVRIEEYFSTANIPVTFAEVQKLVERNSVRHARAFFWSMLQRHHSSISISKAGELMLKAVGGLSEAMHKAVITATPDVKDLEALGVPPPRPRKARTKKRVDGTGVSYDYKPVA